MSNPKFSLRGANTTFEIAQREAIIGRVSPADILIPGAGVSGRHAKLTWDGLTLTIEDLNSTNGTFINGQRIHAPTPLRHGDEVRLGQSVTITCELPTTGTVYEGAPGAGTVYEPPAPPPPVAPPPAMPAPPRPQPVQPAAAGPGGYAQTVFGQVPVSGEAGPPKLLVSVAGGESQVYELNRPQVTIGREAGNDIVVNSNIVSRRHAQLQQSSAGGYNLIIEANTSNPTFIDGKPVNKLTSLHHGAKIRVGSNDPGLMVTMTYIVPGEAAANVQPVKFGEKNLLQIGRDRTNDIVLDVSQVSRFHAQIERVGKRYRVRDLRSTNGTFVNGQEIEGEVWLKPNDTVRVGSYSFLVGEEELAQVDESGGLHVEAVGLNKWVRKDLNILQNISLNLEPREFVVVVGQSGGGKSTLVDCIAGYRPASHGKVFVNGIDLYDNFDAIRNDIGYVPQKDIIHMELTVFQALDYAAQLRMPPDTSRAERHQRVMETLEDLDIAHRKDTQISRLSGGQQKRVSIGVELLTRPGLFFLDEPSSGLDPGTETALMQLMRRLADQGRTIILITHATKNVVLADKVVFLARGGYLAWFGPPEEALEYFNQYRSERDQRAAPMEFDEIYALLDDPARGKATDWAERYQRHQAYQKYIAAPLAPRGQQPQGRRAASGRAGKLPRRKKVGAIRQFLILSFRNLRILTRDRFSLFLMLASAPLVGLLDILLANLMGSNPFAWLNGDVNAVIITLFLLTIYGVMVGGIAQMREIVKEADIYKRERLVNLKIFPYILSKVWVAALLAAYQAAWYIGIHYYAFDMPGSWTEFGLMYTCMALATMTGMMLGLFASAVAPTANAAPLIVILLMLPQIVLGGALVPVPGFISAPTATRWAFQGFIAITGVGSDVAKDACFLLSEEELGLMQLEAKTANCNCLGLNVLKQESCDFPGLGAYYNEGAFASPPVEPPPLREPPPEPFIPDPPAEPVDQSDTVAVAEYLAALQEYQTTIEAIRAQYELELEAYEAEAEVYAVQLEEYGRAAEEYGKTLVSAVIPAEGTLLIVDENFHWAWVNKDNPDEYYGVLAATWMAQLILQATLLALILLLQKRKDKAGG